MVYAMMAVLLFGGAPPAEVMRVSARIDAESLDVGKEYALVVRTSFAQGVSASGAGIPLPLIQLQVPASVKLVGKELTSLKELSKNEFLHAPYERVMRGHEDRIKFTVTAAARPGDAIAINVMAYVSDESANDAWFIRRRLNVPLSPGAESHEADANDSTWGADQTLKIGDAADDFALPQGDGATVSLKDFRGKFVVACTYRAHW